MMEHSGPEYLVRDPHGNVYGPAEPALLRQWAAQGRIVPGMYIAPKDTSQWVEASVHPELAGCFGAPAAAQPAEPAGPATPTPPTVQPPEPTAQSSEPARRIGAETPVAAPGWADAGRRENVPALVSMIAGIVAVAGLPAGCLCGCFGGPLVGMAALVAVVLGLVAMSQIKADPLRYTGKNRAVAGLVLGAISLVLMVVGAILVAALGMAHR